MLQKIKEWAKKQRSLSLIDLLLKKLFWIIRVQKITTKLLGPKHNRSCDSIEICVTNLCNLRCINCDMSCRQAPSNERLDVSQIKKFIRESIEKNIKWKKIRLLGGEPTLHPEILEIINLLLEYKKKYSPKARIQIVTNGYGTFVNQILSKIPKGIEFENSSKKPEDQPFHPFNIAPQDCAVYRNADYSNGCRIMTSNCGIGLITSGYYPCLIAGGIDRVLGFDYGRKELPSKNDSMTDLLNAFCKFCGHFRYAIPTNQEIISPSWKKAYEKYKSTKPRLSLY